MIKLYGYSRNCSKLIPVKFWKFPAGECGLKIENPEDCCNRTKFSITVDFRGSDDLIYLLLLVDAIRNIENTDIELFVPYFPYARQDRVMNVGESHSLRVIADLIKLCNFKKIVSVDPHSGVLSALFGAGVFEFVDQSVYAKEKLSQYIGNGMTWVVSPDAGALKKIYKVAKELRLPVIEARKIRDVSTGDIVATKVESLGIKDPVDLLVVDDIIDGGKTFIELAKELKQVYNVRHLVLYASHGIFSKGLEVLDDYDAIYVYNNMSDHDLEAFNNRK